MTVVPTLAVMAGVYALPREGGAKSPRFTSYVKQAEHIYGLSAFNPMAGPVALETVQHLLEIDAEGVAAGVLAEVCARCAFGGEVSLAIVVASAGMWTDRLGTEVEHRLNRERSPVRGTVLLWTREPVSEADVRRETAAEAIRVIHTATHGPAVSVAAVLAREGLAYAPSLNTYVPSAALAAAPDGRVAEAIGVLGDTTAYGEMIGVLYGDSAAQALGYATLGVPDRAGFAWAVGQAEGAIAEVGVERAMAEFRVSVL